MKTTIFTAFLLCTSVMARAQQAKLSINVTNVEPGKGTVILNIYDKKEDFLKKVFLSKTLKADDSNLTFVIELPRKGIYAITVFQDKDDNKKLKQDWFGIPQEPVGYGNNFKPSAKPGFKDCSIRVDRDHVIQTIKLY
ncbi:DUF2141 domain-containing protein [Sphingobacterium spiritivorum]|uniref:DUF2141 domain-containing protein n=1 Tax=Sphingobacterium spiritivorum ATCC 33861 TaxID=525373 RepID=D7VK69_SPHSI|nr:DUF2141 domain-containing protein [Sphingobacterium spiritivorum]EFK58671.1 hypothetical protein HMPREF0766_11388 [Sphingobacterium spiritivorum ATCC 33861]WQD35283.1 DUF2141 domain-containing protein [Sphingobacterium spiritivorum]SUI99879.1 Uncharacterized protein conserved in bacteria [Sphingobacterium spiritivorum]